ncbi:MULTISPECIES: dihydroorotase [Sphingobacterium]|jgi:dihydroorotase|uniref:dihydroorotase n=1 Tax=Sphingobacterium TaxID=28453 RepID=UPI00038A4598|nr:MULTISPECIES: dihydroorotase [unclassified Sphingobacterium]KKX47056.1 dihydroorotase [Sphingobacterium sp. IITKGP-BTPF85]MBB2952497.1 dihydroorotase [Sphingobacterium sp. JUb56]MCS3555879.1 dihydroorotase [Sphingobacterium sp. JUb21]NJI76395.1 dihydroorotase [Sphingobacterium sp. B16(2022)]QQD11876.1 dihydroorotase [Sphingobacterium sp. UDSM-2020]
MSTILIKSAQIVNEGKITTSDVYISNGRIEMIAAEINHPADREINAEGLHLLPGLIDDQVHFREPGLTHKADIWHESRAAVAGGTTSFMEMPNTVPNTLTQSLLQDKYDIASQNALANYSFFMGAANDNLEEVLKTNPRDVCGVKVFMGSSTGNMLVDNERALEQIFANSPTLVATHCEDEATIQENLAIYKEKYGEAGLTIDMHPLIRSAEACYISSSKAVELAKKNNTRLHILHISTAKEIGLFRNDIPLAEKLITAEACIHHMWFSDVDYKTKGNFIKWNPAVKTADDRDAIVKAVLDGHIDVIATDHAPHTIAEKTQAYSAAPSGGPLVQHALQALLDMYHEGKITLEQIVQKSAHNTAICFQIEERGFIREGYWADLVLVDLNKPYTVTKSNILSKCGWSPFEDHTFKSSIEHTIVSGQLAYSKGSLIEYGSGRRLLFNR